MNPNNLPLFPSYGHDSFSLPSDSGYGSDVLRALAMANVNPTLLATSTNVSPLTNLSDTANISNSTGVSFGASVTIANSFDFAVAAAASGLHPVTTTSVPLNSLLSSFESSLPMSPLLGGRGLVDRRGPVFNEQLSLSPEVLQRLVEYHRLLGVIGTIPPSPVLAFDSGVFGASNLSQSTVGNASLNYLRPQSAVPFNPFLLPTAKTTSNLISSNTGHFYDVSHNNKSVTGGTISLDNQASSIKPVATIGGNIFGMSIGGISPIKDPIDSSVMIKHEILSPVKTMPFNVFTQCSDNTVAANNLMLHSPSLLSSLSFITDGRHEHSITNTTTAYDVSLTTPQRHLTSTPRKKRVSALTTYDNNFGTDDERTTEIFSTIISPSVMKITAPLHYGLLSQQNTPNDTTPSKLQRNDGKLVPSIVTSFSTAEPVYHSVRGSNVIGMVTQSSMTSSSENTNLGQISSSIKRRCLSECLEKISDGSFGRERSTTAIDSSGERSLSSDDDRIAMPPPSTVPHIFSEQFKMTPSTSRKISTTSLSSATTTSTATNVHYPPHFIKGSLIQMADGQILSVESLKTEDFIRSAEASADLSVDSSTVMKIRESFCTVNGDDDDIVISPTIMITFAVGKYNIEMTVEATREHPFFVFGEGWSSYDPNATMSRFHLSCRQLEVGDVCVSLTHKNAQKCVAHLNTITSVNLQKEKPINLSDNDNIKRIHDGSITSSSFFQCDTKSMPSVISTTSKFTQNHNTLFHGRQELYMSASTISNTTYNNEEKVFANISSRFPSPPCKTISSLTSLSSVVMTSPLSIIDNSTSDNENRLPSDCTYTTYSSKMQHSFPPSNLKISDNNSVSTFPSKTTSSTITKKVIDKNLQSFITSLSDQKVASNGIFSSDSNDENIATTNSISCSKKLDKHDIDEKPFSDTADYPYDNEKNIHLSSLNVNITSSIIDKSITTHSHANRTVDYMKANDFLSNNEESDESLFTKFDKICCTQTKDCIDKISSSTRGEILSFLKSIPVSFSSSCSNLVSTNFSTTSSSASSFPHHHRHFLKRHYNVKKKQLHNPSFSSNKFLINMPFSSNSQYHESQSSLFTTTSHLFSTKYFSNSSFATATGTKTTSFSTSAPNLFYHDIDGEHNTKNYSRNNQENLSDNKYFLTSDNKDNMMFSKFCTTNPVNNKNIFSSDSNNYYRLEPVTYILRPNSVPLCCKSHSLFVNDKTFHSSTIPAWKGQKDKNISTEHINIQRSTNVHSANPFINDKIDFSRSRSDDDVRNNNAIISLRVPVRSLDDPLFSVVSRICPSEPLRTSSNITKPISISDMLIMLSTDDHAPFLFKDNCVKKIVNDNNCNNVFNVTRSTEHHLLNRDVNNSSLTSWTNTTQANDTSCSKMRTIIDNCDNEDVTTMPSPSSLLIPKKRHLQHFFSDHVLSSNGKMPYASSTTNDGRSSSSIDFTTTTNSMMKTNYLTPPTNSSVGTTSATAVAKESQSWWLLKDLSSSTFSNDDEHGRGEISFSWQQHQRKQKKLKRRRCISETSPKKAMISQYFSSMKKQQEIGTDNNAIDDADDDMKRVASEHSKSILSHSSTIPSKTFFKETGLTKSVLNNNDEMVIFTKSTSDATCCDNIDHSGNSWNENNCCRDDTSFQKHLSFVKIPQQKNFTKEKQMMFNDDPVHGDPIADVNSFDSSSTGLNIQQISSDKNNNALVTCANRLDNTDKDTELNM